MHAGIASGMHLCIMADMTPAQAIARLKSAGMTEAAIGSAVQANQSTIYRITQGRDPRWELGNRLIALAARRGSRNRSN